MALAAEVIPKYTMNNQLKIPALALGTYLGFDQNGIIQPKGKEVKSLIENAIAVGYTHIDTGSIYGTEPEIGEAVNTMIDNGTIVRDDVFITTKLWNTHHKKDDVNIALREALKRLNLEYVDLYLMHWPIGLNSDQTPNDIDYMETWKAMEELQRLGLTKSIGVSNFNQQQIERVMKEGSIQPAVLQIEVNPNLPQQDLVDFAQKNGIIVMGYSPFGYLVPRAGTQKMENTYLETLSKKYNKSVYQMALIWLANRKIIPVPKTIKISRLSENMNIFDVQLTADEMDKMSQPEFVGRYTLPSFWQNHPYYPFEKIENPIANPFL